MLGKEHQEKRRNPGQRSTHPPPGRPLINSTNVSNPDRPASTRSLRSPTLLRIESTRGDSHLLSASSCPRPPSEETRFLMPPNTPWEVRSLRNLRYGMPAGRSSSSDSPVSFPR